MSAALLSLLIARNARRRWSERGRHGVDSSLVERPRMALPARKRTSRTAASCTVARFSAARCAHLGSSRRTACSVPASDRRLDEHRERKERKHLTRARMAALEGARRG